jgi:hypothetical protein
VCGCFVLKEVLGLFCGDGRAGPSVFEEVSGT